MRILDRIIGGSIAAAAVLALSASTTQAQSLVNGSFEDAGGFTANPITTATVDQGWALFNGAGSAGRSDMSASTDAPYDGSYALLETTGPGNNWNPAGAYQIITGLTPGQTYTFGVWALTDTTETWNQGILVQLGFVQPSNLGAPSTVETPGGTVGINGTIPPQNTWTYYSVNATPPPGYTDAIVYLMFQDNNSAVATENMYYDAASVTAVPEPSILALLGLAVPCSFLLRRKG